MLYKQYIKLFEEVWLFIFLPLCLSINILSEILNPVALFKGVDMGNIGIEEKNSIFFKKLKLIKSMAIFQYKKQILLIGLIENQLTLYLDLD